ncbi:MAG: CBS domain-containing protein [Spirochaetia bacterium]|nr:CBS domain-containing protein [Spirochaetia bacterium]
MSTLKDIRKMAISKLMKKEIITVDRHETVAKVMKLIQNSEKTMAIIVKPRDEDDAYGIVTERDILEKVIDPGKDIYRDPWNTPVSDIMSKPLISVYPEIRVKYAIRLMRKTMIRHIAVMESSKLVGILSETDLISYIADVLPEDGEKPAL